MTDVVDLCSSSSDSDSEDDERVPESFGLRKPSVTAKAAAVGITIDESSSDDHDEDKGFRGKPSRCGPRVSSSGRSVVTPEDRGAQPKAAAAASKQPVRSLFPPVRPRSRPIPNQQRGRKPSSWSSSDDDDDDELLKCSSGLTRKKNPAEPTPPVGSTSESPAPPPLAEPQHRAPRARVSHGDAPPTDGEAAADHDELPYPRLEHLPLHPDVRADYVGAFWGHARTLVHASYHAARLDQTARRIHALALSEHPIRSLEEYCQAFARTTDPRSVEEALGATATTTKAQPGTNPYRKPDRAAGFHGAPPIDDGTPGGGDVFGSITEAALVSLLEHVQARAGSASVDLSSAAEVFLRDKAAWIYLADWMPRIDARLHPSCPGRLVPDHARVLERREGTGLDALAEHYLRSSTRSAEFAQLSKLAARRAGGQPLVKAHSHGGKRCYEMTPSGYATARRLLRRRRGSFPATPGPYRTSRFASAGAVPPRFRGICLAVDDREGGGPKHKLHSMCNKLDTLEIPYFVGLLHIGDYCFFQMRPGTDRHELFPVLVERKSIQDVAQSIYDGRWKNQKRRMYQGQFVLGYEDSRLVFVIEGTIDAQQLTGGYVGQRHFDVTTRAVAEALRDLEHEGFEVLRTASPEHSLVELSKLGASVLEDHRRGRMATRFTYEEFREEVCKIPPRTDFSRIAIDQAASRRTKNAVDDDGAGTTPGAAGHPPRSPGKLQQTKLSFGATPTAKRTKGSTSPVQLSTTSTKEEEEDGTRYNGWTVALLRTECARWGLAKSGNKAALIARLKGPRPPGLWVARKQQGHYVPTRHDTCATALLVALWREQRHSAGDNDWRGLSKEELYVLAERLEISRTPFSGAAMGPYRYDGWSSMGDLRSGELPLVVHQRGGFFKLTTVGFPFAEAMHEWCREHGVPSCTDDEC